MLDFQCKAPTRVHSAPAMIAVYSYTWSATNSGEIIFTRAFNIFVKDTVLRIFFNSLVHNNCLFISHSILWNVWHSILSMFQFSCQYILQLWTFLSLYIHQSCPRVTFLGPDPTKRWPVSSGWVQEKPTRTDPTRDCWQKVWPDPTRGPTLPLFV